MYFIAYLQSFFFAKRVRGCHSGFFLIVYAFWRIYRPFSVVINAGRFVSFSMRSLTVQKVKIRHQNVNENPRRNPEADRPVARCEKVTWSKASQGTVTQFYFLHRKRHGFVEINAVPAVVKSLKCSGILMVCLQSKRRQPDEVVDLLRVCLTVCVVICLRSVIAWPYSRLHVCLHTHQTAWMSACIPIRLNGRLLAYPSD